MTILILILWIILLASFTGIIFVISRRFPAMMALPEESLAHQETFHQFFSRKKSEVPMRIENIRISFLEKSDKRLTVPKKIISSIGRVFHYLHEMADKNNSLLGGDSNKIQDAETANFIGVEDTEQSSEQKYTES